MTPRTAPAPHDPTPRVARRACSLAFSACLAAAGAGGLGAAAYGADTRAASDSAEPAPDSAAFRAAQARAGDAETLRALSAEGQVLYQRDRIKLAGFEYCSQALSLAERGEFRASVQAAAKALHLGQVQSDAALVAAARRDFAIAYSYAGDLDSAERHAAEALRQAGADSPRIAGPAYKTLGDVRLRRGQAAEAIAAYRSALEVSSERFRPLVEISLANAYVAAGDAARAGELYARIEPPSLPGARQLFQRGLANLRLAEARPAEALALFEQAAAQAGGIDASYHRVWALDGVGRARLALADRAGAREAFAQAARAADGMRARFRSEEFKTGLFGDVQQVFERAIALAADDGDAEAAWQLSEASRARALLDSVRERTGTGAAARAGQGALQPLPLEAVREALRADETLVQYHSLADRLLVWRIDARGATLSSVALPREALEAAVAGLRQAVFERSRTVAEPAARLQAQLLGALQPPAGTRLLIVPHGALHYLPFQALRGADGYLIERHPVAVLPSASVAVRLARAPRVLDARLVAFGNPRLAAGSHPPLPGAEREVRRIAQLFAQPSVYLEGDASRRRFRASAGAGSVLHVAAHAEVDALDPLQSRILLADDGAEPGALAAREVYGLDLGGVGLVVISACESGLGRIARGDEILGFTRSFLSAGASGLVVSLWPVSDASTELLMGTFYAELARGAEAIDAMRAGQLAVLRRARFAHPFFWAPFDLIGNWRVRTGAPRAAGEQA